MIERLVRAYNEKDEPDEADVEVDGESMDTEWNRPAWEAAKKAALRKYLEIRAIRRA